MLIVSCIGNKERKPKKCHFLTTDNLGHLAHTVSTVDFPHKDGPNEGHRLSRRHFKLSAQDVDQLAYHIQIKEMDPNWDKDKDDHLWKAHAILDHSGGRKAKVNVMWSDLHATWEDLNATF